MEKSFSGTTSSKPLHTRAGDEYELLKYMSKLPVFLERAETTPQEKLLSVGVLDRGRLEKWQHSHNRIPLKNRIPTVSQADGSFALPRDESSAGPSKVHNRSSDCRMKHRTSRHSNVLSTSVEETVKENQEIRCNRKKKHKDRRCLSIPDEQLGPTTDAQGLDGCEKEDLKEKNFPKDGTLSHGLNPEAGLNIEVRSKADSDRRKKRGKNLHERHRNDHDGKFGQKEQGEAKTCKRSSTRKARVVHGVEVGTCTQHSCPLPCKADGCLAKSTIGSSDAEANKVSVELSQCMPLSTKARSISSKGKITEDRASSLLSVRHCIDESAQRQDSKSHKVASEKGRSISPFQRRSFGVGKTSKTNSEGVAVPTTQLDSMANSTKIDSQNVALLSDVDGSDCKPSEKDTTTTSHLRRLLEPLLKPRTIHSGNSVEGPRGQGVQRIKLGITGCKTVNVNDSAHEKKLGSSMVRAVLRITVKNNQPLFTFAVNKETDIFAATQKKMGSSEEGECTSVYTFFSIKDHKRNSGWLNQRGRGQTHGIISNVVAQMRVSSSLPSGSIREFVLFSVELDQESTENSDLQLKNELAAIIVKMPRWFHRRASLNTVQDHNALNEELEDHIKDKFFDQDISATVILQSGVHSMPHKGGPSSLIQRWRTGGSCDCGGWDMGCNLRILTNQHNLSCKNSTPSNSPPSSNRFELFFLGEQPEEHPYLSFKPIKEGIYSVVYNSSLSQLQAFSICMALADSRKMSEITLEHKSSCDEHRARAKTVLVPDQDPNPNGNTIGYQPPLLPVGRV